MEASSASVRYGRPAVTPILRPAHRWNARDVLQPTREPEHKWLRIERRFRIKRRRSQHHVVHPALHGIPAGQRTVQLIKQKPGPPRGSRSDHPSQNESRVRTRGRVVPPLFQMSRDHRDRDACFWRSPPTSRRIAALETSICRAGGWVVSWAPCHLTFASKIAVHCSTPTALV